MKWEENRAALGPQNEDEKIIFAEEALLAETQIRLHEVLVEMGLSQKTIAERLGVTPACISQYFAAGCNLTLRTLARVCCALGQTPRVEITPAVDTQWAFSSTGESVSASVTPLWRPIGQSRQQFYTSELPRSGPPSTKAA